MSNTPVNNPSNAPDAPAPTPQPAAYPPGPPFVHFRRHEVQPPSNVYIAPDDQLQLLLFSSAYTTFQKSIQLTGRILEPDGRIVPFQYDIVYTPTAQGANFNFPTTEGFLLSVTLRTPTDDVQSGEIFATIGLARGASPLPIMMYTLTAGYITTGANLGWPGGGVDDRGEVAGSVQTTPLTLQASPLQAGFVTPQGGITELLTLQVKVTTSAAVGQRYVHLSLTDGFARWDKISPVTMAAGQTYSYSWGIGDPAEYATAVNGFANHGLPEALVIGEGDWTVGIDNALAGDAFDSGSASYRVRWAY